MAENEALQKQLVLAMRSSLPQSEDVEGSNIFKLLVECAKRNAGRHKNGLRFFSAIKELGNIVYSLGGPRLHNLLAPNLHLPTMSTVRRTLHNNSPIHEGMWRFKELKTFLASRNFSSTVWVSEDGTRVNGRIQYDIKSNQVVGFVPELDENGLPLELSFPATSASVIKSYFDTGVVSNSVYAVMVQPLALNAPSFCLALWGTDNRFTSQDVLARWKWMDKTATEHGITIAGYSSDGDNKLLSAMYSCVFQEKDHHKWPWFNASFKSDLGVPIQDTIHVLVKLRQKLIKPSDIMPMGRSNLASRGHLISLISTVSKDLHKMNMTTINVKDKMNFKSAQTLCSSEVSDLLRKNIPGSEGTACFLDMMREVTSVFLEHSLQPLERVTIMWSWVFFLRFWRQYILKNNAYSLSHNFITSNAYTCIEVNAHSLINIMRRLRDSEQPELFLIMLFSSQTCEDFFRRCRCMSSIGSTVINFSMLEMNQKVKRVDFLAESFFNLKDTLIIPKQHKKLYSLPAPQDTAANVILPEDYEIEEAVNKALKLAVTKCVQLGILNHPTSVHPKCPLTSVCASVLPFLDEDDDVDVDLEDEPALDQEDEEVIQDVVEDLLVISSGQIGLKTFDNVDLSPNSPFVKVADGHGTPAIIRKSTLLWMLSTGDTSMSSDRLLRVQTETAQHPKRTANASTPLPQAEETVSIGDWCAFTSENGKDISIGRILAFAYLSGSTWRDQTYSAISAPVKPPDGLKSRRGIGCLCTWYTVSKNRKLTITKMDVQGYYDIDNYVCTIPRPLVNEKNLMLPCLLQDIVKIQQNNK